MLPKVAQQIDLFLKQIEILKIQIKTYCNKKTVFNKFKSLKICE